MTTKKKQPATGPSANEQNTAQPIEGNEPWRKWKVKPDLAIIFFHTDDARAKEIGIGKRVAYCRGQLDNLSVEALARYTKNFDSAGISKASLVRYEAGDSLPGARELRILCDALWVSPNWLLYGTVDSNSPNKAATALLDALSDFVRGETVAGTILDFTWAKEQKEIQHAEEVERRQRWIDEARKPHSR